jgi:hypothetical protein
MPIPHANPICASDTTRVIDVGRVLEVPVSPLAQASTCRFDGCLRARQIDGSALPVNAAPSSGPAYTRSGARHERESIVAACRPVLMGITLMAWWAARRTERAPW